LLLGHLSLLLLLGTVEVDHVGLALLVATYAT
jgi:hypothetical protein